MGIRHLRIKKEMTFNQKFITKWNEEFRKQIGVYEPIISLKKLFKEPAKPIKKLI